MNLIPAHYYVEDFEDGTLTSSTGRIDRHPLVAGPLQTGQTPNGHGMAGVNDQAAASGHIVAFSHTQGIDAQPSESAWPTLRRDGGGHGVAYALRKDPGGTGQGHNTNYVAAQAAVRRLTPRECERLQGFPDNWTALGPDSRRYAALGDAVTVPVAQWIGQRLETV